MAAASAFAEPVMYTFSGIASGRAGNEAFSGAEFLVEIQADTSDVTPIDLFDNVIFAVQSQQASFSISGVGSGQFITSTLVFVNQTAGAIGFSQGLVADPTSGQDVFALVNPFFTSYDLRSSAGPILDPSPQVPATVRPLDSTLGQILFTSMDGPATFQAVVVPEPSSLALVSLPMIVGLYWGRRRLRNRA